MIGGDWKLNKAVIHCRFYMIFNGPINPYRPIHDAESWPGQPKGQTTRPYYITNTVLFRFPIPRETFQMTHTYTHHSDLFIYCEIIIFHGHQISCKRYFCGDMISWSLSFMDLFMNINSISWDLNLWIKASMKSSKINPSWNIMILRYTNLFIYLHRNSQGIKILPTTF